MGQTWQFWIKTNDEGPLRPWRVGENSKHTKEAPPQSCFFKSLQEFGASWAFKYGCSQEWSWSQSEIQPLCKAPKWIRPWTLLEFQWDLGA